MSFSLLKKWCPSCLVQAGSPAAHFCCYQDHLKTKYSACLTDQEGICTHSSNKPEAISLPQSFPSVKYCLTLTGINFHPSL